MNSPPTPPRRVAESLFPGASVRYVDRFERIADLFDRFGDQRPSTCGAYAARYLLASLGYPTAGGEDTTREDYLAFLAGTILETEEVEPAEHARREARMAGLTDAEALARFPDTYYGWPLRSADDPAVAGTSPTGVARALGLGSGGALVTLPISARRADGAVLFTPNRFEAMLELLADNLERWQVHPIVNYESDQLLDPTTEAYRAALGGADPETEPPLDSWGVGHFTGVGALWRTTEGQWWMLLLDTYKSRGWSGYEPQPADLVRRGMVREDGREGGLLLVLPREHLDQTRATVEGLGLEVRMWGNGSREPEDWAWTYGR